MKKLSIKEIAFAIGGEIVNPPKRDRRITTGVTMDSRKIEKDNVFVAIKGERVDGHDFLNNVFENGASVAIVDHVPEGVTGTCIVVKDTVKGLQDLAEWYRKGLDVKVIGITGSVGKTSTKEMVAAVLSAGHKVLKTEGNYNNEIGLPLTVMKLEEEHEIAVLEMGISDFGEMRVLSKIARPDIAVITNIGQSHLENLGTRDGILKAKSEIFEYMNPGGNIYLNGDDDKLRCIRLVNGLLPVTFGFTSENNAFPTSVKSLGLGGTEMTVNYRGHRFDAAIKMIGNHNVTNAMAASAIALDLGMEEELVISGLKSAETISGRSNLIKRNRGYIIDDCYNAAPTSMKAAIDTLTLADGRKVAILGDMFELGRDEAKLHEEVGNYAAKKNIDKLITIGSLAKNIYDGSKASGAKYEIKHFDSLEAFLEKINEEIDANDNVLVKASNGMKFSKIVEELNK